MAALAAGLMLKTPAHAQENKTYDPIMEKRSDLRLKFWHDQREAGNAEPNSAPAQNATVHKEYSGMVDFVTLAAKRSDMRLRAAHIGYASACEEWMGRCQTKTANKAIVKASPGFAVPFTFDPLLQPQIIVQIRIDGQAPLPFLVDTGLNAGLLIDTQATQKLHLQCDTAAPVISIGKIDARRTHLNSVSFLGTANTSLPVDGLFLDVPAHKPMEVVGLLPHCVGEEAGLRTGDTILEFNGLPASEITPAVLAVEFRKPLLTLKVQRQGIGAAIILTLTAIHNKETGRETARAVP